MKRVLSVCLAFLLMCPVAVNATTLRYYFEGTITEGEVAGYGFGGWFIYDTACWDEYIPVEMMAYAPLYLREDYTGDIIIGTTQFYSPFMSSSYQGLISLDLPSQFYVTGMWASGPMYWVVDMWLKLEWEGHTIESGDLLPLSHLTEAVFDIEGGDCVGWFDGVDTFYPYEWSGSGIITTLKPVPEPISILFFGSGLMALAWLRKKLRK